jgi:hypothetical protein
MNYSTAVFLINNDVRAVVGIYESEDDLLLSKKPFSRITFKTLDSTIKVGDFVVVPTDTRHKMTVVKIVEVDTDIDFDSNTQINWVISTLDKTSYEKTLALEQTAIAVMKSAELRKKKSELRDSVFKDQAESLKTLELSTVPPSPPKV